MGFATLVLLYRMLEYRAPASVLYGSSMTALKYFFDIQTVAQFQNPLAATYSGVAQFSVTAPFTPGCVQLGCSGLEASVANQTFHV